MTTTNKFLERVKTHQDSRGTEKFSGTLEQYLELLEKDSNIAVLAHKRLHEQIISHGVTTLDESDDRCNKIFDGEDVKIFDYFSSQFFGMERPLEKVMRFLRSASMRGEESRQVLLGW